MIPSPSTVLRPLFLYFLLSALLPLPISEAWAEPPPPVRADQGSGEIPDDPHLPITLGSALRRGTTAVGPDHAV